MQRLILIAFCSLFIVSQSFAGSTGSGTHSGKATRHLHGPRPDLPGSLLINLGSSYFYKAPDIMKVTVFGSRPLDIYYTYPIDIKMLRLSVVPGIGFGFDRYSFRRPVALSYKTTGTATNLRLDSITHVEVLSSKLVTNYVDLPVELRFVPLINQKEQSAFVGIGASIGYLFEAHTKFKYRENDQKKLTKQQEDWNLNPIRYSWHARVGFGSFSVYYKMGISPVFRKGHGPNGFDITSNTIGISFHGF